MKIEFLGFLPAIIFVVVCNVIYWKGVIMDGDWVGESPLPYVIGLITPLCLLVSGVIWGLSGLIK